MIEVDESLIKPSNLANSAVLKALEEEENEQYGVRCKERRRQQETSKNTRESRPRQRVIVDRDTVLKINRRGSRHRSRDHSWPPPQAVHERSRSASDEIHFDERVCKQHRIDSIARKFDHGQEEEGECAASTAHKSGHWLSADAGHHVRERSRTPEWPPAEQTPLLGAEAKTFSLPEHVEHLHVGILEPKKKFFEKIADSESKERSPSLGPRKKAASRGEQLHVSFVEPHKQGFEGVAELDEYQLCREKPWKSTESLYQPCKPASHFISRPQTVSLDRYTSRRHLPPLKPRNKSPTWSSTKAKAPTSTMPSSTVTIQLSPPAGRNQINYETSAMNNKRDPRPAKPAAPRIIDSCRTRSPQPGQMSTASPSSCKRRTAERNFASHPAGQSRPIGSDCSNGQPSRRNPTSTQPQLNLASTLGPVPHKDDAYPPCIRSIDLMDDTSGTPVQPGEVAQQPSSPRATGDGKLQTKQENIAPAPQDYNKTATRNENKFERDPDTNTAGDHPPNGDKYRAGGGNFATAPPSDSNTHKSPSGSETKLERRKGIYYTDGEYLFGPFPNPDEEGTTTPQERRQPKVTIIPIQVEQSSQPSQAPPQPPPPSDGIESTRLQQKCGEIQQSITEDLRQIDRYMMQAKMALNRLQHHHQPLAPPQLAVLQTPSVETPLQAAIRRIFRVRRSPSPRPAVVSLCADCTNTSLNEVENVPVVERALLDLSNLAAALAVDEYRDNAMPLETVILSAPMPETPSPQCVLVDITEPDNRCGCCRFR